MNVFEDIQTECFIIDGICLWTSRKHCATSIFSFFHKVIKNLRRQGRRTKGLFSNSQDNDVIPFCIKFEFSGTLKPLQKAFCTMIWKYDFTMQMSRADHILMQILP